MGEPRPPPALAPLVKPGRSEATTRLQRWETGGNGFPRVITLATDRKTVDLQPTAS